MSIKTVKFMVYIFSLSLFWALFLVDIQLNRFSSITPENENTRVYNVQQVQHCKSV